MTKQEVIKLAIEKGGYKTNWYRNGVWTTGEQYGTVFVHNDGLQAILTDPLFWQALGKAGLLPEWDNPNDTGYFGAKGRALTWKDSAHRWFDSVLNGTEDKFWSELK